MFCGPIPLLPNPRLPHRFHISLHLVYRPLPYGPTSPGGSLGPSRVDPGPRPLHTLERYYPCMDWWPGEIAGVYSYTYCISSNNSALVLSYQWLPTRMQCGEALARRRKEDGRVGSASRGMVRRLGRFFSRVRHRGVPDRDRVPKRCHSSGAALDVCRDAPAWAQRAEHAADGGVVYVSRARSVSSRAP